jgi:hypothetical protein
MSEPAAARQPFLSRVLITGGAGKVAAITCLFAAYMLGGGYAASLDTTPEVTRGLHPTEFEPGGRSFAWTTERASLVLEGLDRSRAWTLVVHAKAGRGPGLPLPIATIGVNGTAQAPIPVGAAWQEIRVGIPMAPARERGRPTRVTIDVAPTFVPGPGDPRTLGLIVDDVRLVPDGLAWPPRRAWMAAGLAGLWLGLAIAFIGVPTPWAMAFVLGFALAQSLAISGGDAPYVRGYLTLVPRLAGTVAAVMAALAGRAALLRQRALSPTAASAVAVAAIGLVLGLEGLLHPSKAIVDAMFHAHRLEAVLGGEYFFTQPMPSGVAFPYAIGLYVVAAPWAAIARDHVLLLRVVVAAAHVLAALALYPVAVRRWTTPGAAVVAVGAYLLAPLPFVVIGNANQTYAFGQSVATIALAAAMTLPLGLRPPLVAAGAAGAVVALLALGLLSHVGLILLLGALAGATALFLVWRGEGADRTAGWLILAATAVAAVLAVGLYYRHFGDAFRSALRVGPGGEAAAPAVTEAPPSESAATAPPSTVQVAGTSRPARAGRALALAHAAFGVPLLFLAAMGVSQLRWRDIRDRSSALVVASIVVCVVVGAASVLAPVEPRFERYTDEFISRLYYAVTPAVALLAARGASALWNRGLPGRGVTCVTLVAAVIVAARPWLGWFR